MANVEKMIAETFLEMAQGLESGSYGKRPKIALTGMGSEHGEENAMEAALMAAKDGVDVYYIGSLEAEGVTVTHEGIDKRIDYALKISGYDYLGGLKSFRDGLFFVQDISSMLASQGGFIKRDAYVIAHVNKEAAFYFVRFFRNLAHLADFLFFFPQFLAYIIDTYGRRNQDKQCDGYQSQSGIMNHCFVLFFFKKQVVHVAHLIDFIRLRDG